MNKENQGERETIRVKMLGSFRISVGNASISDTDTRTRQLWHLLQYLVTFRNKTISQEEIIKVMWPENNIENPVNALKNLVYRIRTTFKEWNIPYAREMIVYNRGSYQWNNKLPCVVDVEEFEKLCAKAQNASEGVEYQLNMYQQAIDLYKGDFLPGSSSESWVIPISSYLRTLFFKSVYAKLEILKEQGTEEAYEKIVLTCQRTLIIDPLEEAIHRYLIFAFYNQGQQKEAINQYKYITTQLMKELGLGPSDAMQNLFRIISKNSQTYDDIETLKADLVEVEVPVGAFYCEYEVFKNLYRLEARTAARTGKVIFVCMLTLESPTGRRLTLEMQNEAVDVLHKAVESSLRKGDVFSRFSPKQYALLLTTGSKSNCEVAINRVLESFRKNCNIGVVNVHVKMLPLEPITN